MSTGQRHYEKDFRRLANIIEGARIGTWEWNVQTGETVFNEMWADFVGYTLDELEPVSIDTWIKLAHPEDLKRSEELLRQHFAGESPWYDSRCRMRHKDGHWIWVHDRGKVISQTADGQPLMMFGTHTDITDIMRSEQALRAEEAKYKALFEQSLLGIYLHDLDGRILDVNDMACSQSGFTKEELLQRTVFDNHPQNPEPANLSRDDIKKQWKHWQVGRRVIVEAVHQRKDGSAYPVEISTGTVCINDAIYMLAIVQDLTERKKASESLLRLQRFESLAILAGGIAHDFNNLLSGVFGNIDLAIDSSRDPQVTFFLERAMGVVSQARGLTQQLLTFSQGGTPDKKIQPIEPVVRKTTEFALSGSNVSCSFHFSDDLWHCSFDKTQIGQVIENIVINARQAMPGGGRVMLRAENFSGDSPPKGLKPGRYIHVSIVDRGVGISREAMSKIFDPFYTTKETGHGLGLATSFSILQRHGGTIEVESTPGEGSTFHIYLPASKTSGGEKPKEESREHHGSGRILIMDDEPIIRDTLRAMLESFGYEVVEAQHGEEAIEILKRNDNTGRPFRAMFFDLTVPGGLGGKAALEKIRELGVTPTAFVLSGYSDDDVMTHPQKFGFAASMRKPFTMREIAEVLTRYLKANGNKGDG